MISSRESIYLSKRLVKAPSISSMENQSFVERDIRSYIRRELCDLRHRFGTEAVQGIELSVVNLTYGPLGICYT
jgi:hypothetical protein